MKRVTTLLPVLVCLPVAAVGRIGSSLVSAGTVPFTTAHIDGSSSWRTTSAPSTSRP